MILTLKNILLVLKVFLPLLFILSALSCWSIINQSRELHIAGLHENVPLAKGLTGKALNIWDLQLYENTIFIGYGSTVHNSGPIDLVAYDISQDTIVEYCSMATEAIERFTIIKDTLYIPNADPTRGDLKKFSYVVNGVCGHKSIKHRMAHVRNIHFYNDQFYLVGNTRCPEDHNPNCGGVLVLDRSKSSFDNATVSRVLGSISKFENRRWNWFFGLIEIEDKLIIPNAMFTAGYHDKLKIEDSQFLVINNNDSVSWSADMLEESRLQHHHFYPNEPHGDFLLDSLARQTSLVIHESVSFENKVLYALRSYSMFRPLYESAYGNSMGVMIKDSLYSKAYRLELPDGDAVGEDIKIVDDEVYVLASKKISQDSFIVFVYSSSNPTYLEGSWREVLRFDSKNIARSFEYSDRRFYFGLGYNEGDAVHDAGQLMVVDLD